MSFAIKYQLDLLGPDLKPGDVLLANSPVAGGSHLPDLTVITPVFSSPEGGNMDEERKQKIIFFTASRGHHADIGGSQPGSMPSNSTALEQEGAEIVSFKLVTDGKFDREGLRERMVDRPAKVKGCSGCRDFRSVESDIKAVSGQCRNLLVRLARKDEKADQMMGNGVSSLTANSCDFQRYPASASSNRRIRSTNGSCLHAAYPGVSCRLSFDTEVVLISSNYSNAETAVRKMLIAAAQAAGSTTLSVSPLVLDTASRLTCLIEPDTGLYGIHTQATDYMDDGSPIVLTVTIDDKKGSATFDFTGTGPEVRGNWNAPISVVHSAIIYWQVIVTRMAWWLVDT